MELIAMTEYVLKHKEYIYNNNIRKVFILDNIFNYVKFLKQPLKLEMFIPCSEETGLPFEKISMMFINSNDEVPNLRKAYKKAKEKVLFEGFEIIFRDEDMIGIRCNKLFLVYVKEENKILLDEEDIQSEINSIEDLAKYNLELTPTAISLIKNTENIC